MEMDLTEILSRCAYNPTSYVHDSIRYSFLGYPQSSPCTGFQNWYSCTVDPHTNYENYPKTTPGSRNDILGNLCLKCGIANTALLDYDYFCDTGKTFCNIAFAPSFPSAVATLWKSLAPKDVWPIKRS